MCSDLQRVCLLRSKDERVGLLKGTGVPEAVDTDLANIQREYTQVVLPFITKHPEYWSPDTHTLDMYTKLVAFVMAYRLVRVMPSTIPPIHFPYHSTSLLSFFYVVSRSHKKRTTMKMMSKSTRLQTHQ